MQMYNSTNNIASKEKESHTVDKDNLQWIDKNA